MILVYENRKLSLSIDGHINLNCFFFFNYYIQIVELLIFINSMQISFLTTNSYICRSEIKFFYKR